MKLPKPLDYKIIITFFIIISLISQITCGIIVPDDILPLEISPSYTNTQGKAGTKFIFRFYLPNNIDKDSMPTMRGYGATNGQYLGLRFTPEAPNNLFDTGSVLHSCELIQTENDLNISLIALNDENTDGKNVIYCKIDSYSNSELLLPGYNYKLTITILNDLTNTNDINESVTTISDMLINNNSEIDTEQASIINKTSSPVNNSSDISTISTQNFSYITDTENISTNMAGNNTIEPTMEHKKSGNESDYINQYSENTVNVENLETNSVYASTISENIISDNAPTTILDDKEASDIEMSSSTLSNFSSDVYSDTSLINNTTSSSSIIIGSTNANSENVSEPMSSDISESINIDTIEEASSKDINISYASTEINSIIEAYNTDNINGSQNINHSNFIENTTTIEIQESKNRKNNTSRKNNRSKTHNNNRRRSRFGSNKTLNNNINNELRRENDAVCCSEACVIF